MKLLIKLTPETWKTRRPEGSHDRTPVKVSHEPVLVFLLMALHTETLGENLTCWWRCVYSSSFSMTSYQNSSWGKNERLNLRTKHFIYVWTKNKQNVHEATAGDQHLSVHCNVSNRTAHWRHEDIVHKSRTHIISLLTMCSCIIRVFRIIRFWTVVFLTAQKGLKANKHGCLTSLSCEHMSHHLGSDYKVDVVFANYYPSVSCFHIALCSVLLIFFFTCAANTESDLSPDVTWAVQPTVIWYEHLNLKALHITHDGTSHKVYMTLWCSSSNNTTELLQLSTSHNHNEAVAPSVSVTLCC